MYTGMCSMYSVLWFVLNYLCNNMKQPLNSENWKIKYSIL